jgi:SOS-response transcriptional repressor LexA
VAVALPDGRTLQFRLTATQCKAAFAESSEKNELPDLLKSWFGDNAGLPGTNQTVTFQYTGRRWHIAPTQGSPEPGNAVVTNVDNKSFQIRKRVPRDDQWVRWAPVYDLVASAGSWGPTIAPHVAGWAEVVGVSLKKGMFVARVQGRSMIPRIADGAWCLFRPCPAGSREGRLLLVQIRRDSSVEGEESRFTIKRYHSRKQHLEDGWVHQLIELQSLNPEYPPIVLQPEDADELRVAGEFVRVLT